MINWKEFYKKLRSRSPMQMEAFFVTALTILLAYILFNFINENIGSVKTVEPKDRYFYLFSIALMFLGIRTAQFSREIRVLLRGLFLLVAIMTIFHVCAVYPELHEKSGYSSFDLVEGRWLALFSLALAWFFPSFLLIPFYNLIWQKEILFVVTGLPISKTDFLPVVQIGIFFVLSLSVFAGMVLVRKRTRALKFAQSLRFEGAHLLLLPVLGIYLSNYLYSAIQKGKITEQAFSWPISNRTEYLFINAFEEKAFEIFSFFPGSIEALLKNPSLIVAPLNFFAISVQLLCFLTLFNRRWLVGALIALDLMHLGIFLTTGIFFWKWVIFNFFAALAIGFFQGKFPMWNRLLAAGLAVVAPLFFFTVKLGWLDSGSYNSQSVALVFKSGKTIDLPWEYFGSHSLGFGQSQLADNVFGSLPVSTWGTLGSWETVKDSNRCQLPINSTSWTAEKIYLRGGFADFIRSHHKYLLSNQRKFSLKQFYLFPHHIWSNPIKFSDEEIDLIEVAAYRITTRAKCNRLMGDHYLPLTLFKSEFDLPVKTSVKSPENDDQNLGSAWN